MKHLAQKTGGNYQVFNGVDIIHYPLPDGGGRDIFGTEIQHHDLSMIGFSSHVGPWSSVTNFKALLEFNHQQCYAKVTVSGDNIFVVAVTQTPLTSELQMENMVHEVARASQQLAAQLMN
jgi:hypothetical protein